MTTQTRSRSGTAACIPALESGDRLTREEFHRRYLLRSDIKKAELVKGVVYVPSPTRSPEHSQPHWRLVGALNAFAEGTRGVIGENNVSLMLSDGTELQPDLMLRLSSHRG